MYSLWVPSFGRETAASISSALAVVTVVKKEDLFGFVAVAFLYPALSLALYAAFISALYSS